MNILLPVLMLMIGAALLAAGFAVQKLKFLRKAGCIVLCCLLLEGVFFNLHALTTMGLEEKPLDLSAAQVTVEELPGKETFLSAVTPSGRNIAPIYRTTVIFENLEARCETLALDFAGDNRILDAQVYISDWAYSYGFALSGTVKVSPGSENHHRAVTAFDSNGFAKALKIVFETEDASAKLVSAALDAPVVYRFSLLRYCVFCLSLLLIAAILHFKWHLIIFDRKNSKHIAVYAVSALVCVLLVIFVQYLCTPFDSTRFPYTRALEYPFEKEPYEYRTFAHALMFDAIANQSVEMGYSPVGTNFYLMADPYDPTERVANGVEDYMFDYAYYEGKYYAYFGLTPVIVFYAPFYALMGYLPSYTTAALFFALMSVAAAFLCFYEAAGRFVRKPGLVMMCLCAAALTLGSNVLMLQSCADRYHLSIQSMQLFFFLTLYTALRACREKKRGSRTAWFVSSGICTVLLVWSRATGALSAAAFVIPLFIAVVLSKKEKAFDKVRDAASFLIPLALGAVVIMSYNMWRFDSPFEFGQKYQVTTENIAYNTFNLRSIPQAIYYFFLDGLQTVPEFPYLKVADNFVNRTGNYFYGVSNAGAFTMPLALCIFLMPMVREKCRRGKIFCYGAGVMMTLVIAVSGFIVAGVAQRYVCDILPALCLVGALCALDVAAAETAEKRGTLQALLSVVCVATFAVALAMTFSNYRCFISEYSPDKYLHLFELFTLL